MDYIFKGFFSLPAWNSWKLSELKDDLHNKKKTINMDFLSHWIIQIRYRWQPRLFPFRTYPTIGQPRRTLQNKNLKDFEIPSLLVDKEWRQEVVFWVMDKFSPRLDWKHFLFDKSLKSGLKLKCGWRAVKIIFGKSVWRVFPPWFPISVKRDGVKQTILIAQITTTS